MSNSPAPMLEYESSGSEPTTLEIVDTLDGGVTITVPTRRTVWRFISSMMSADLLAVIFSPFAWVVFRLLATRKPRAVLRMTSTEFAVLQTSDKGLGIVETKQFWPLTEIGELRPNRFEYGLYVTIRGKDSFNLLPDIPPAEIACIGKKLQDVRKRIALSST